MADSGNLVYGAWSEWVFSDEHKQYYTNRQVQNGPHSWFETRWETEFNRDKDTASAPPASTNVSSGPPRKKALKGSDPFRDERGHLRWESQSNRDRDTASVPPASTNVCPAPPRLDSSQTYDSFRDECGYSHRHRVHEGYGDAPISTEGVTMTEQDAEARYADQDLATYNGRRRRLEKPSEYEGNDSEYASLPAQARPERHPQHEGHDSGYTSQFAESKPRLAVSRTQSAPSSVIFYKDVQKVYDLFAIIGGQHHRVEGILDSAADANIVNMGTIRKLGLNHADIQKYSEPQEAFGIGGSCDIFGWITISWYFAETERKYRHQFDVVDDEEDQPLLIGLPTLNREKILQHRVDTCVPVRKQVHKTVKLRSKRPKDTYEAPTMIVDYPAGADSARWITLTPEDEAACRQAALSADRKSDIVQAVDGRQYRIVLTENGDRSYYYRAYS